MSCGRTAPFSKKSRDVLKQEDFCELMLDLVIQPIIATNFKNNCIAITNQ